ncbi:MAG: hypothetical protein HY329_26930 [Chloroflexi bacterium]|nr:hypothetical protein [Chloroflexota bacterium]
MTQRQRARVVFLGMECGFSGPVLRALFAAGVEVAAVVLPAATPVTERSANDERPLRLRPRPGDRTRALPVALGQPPSVVDLAHARGVPVHEAPTLAGFPVREKLAEYAPDFIAVACFPVRVPRAVLSLPRHGCLNVHPSLLPRHRGPAPLFWTFRHDDRSTGVSVYLMNERLDAGDVIRQRAIEVPDGSTGAELDLRCAALGGELLVTAIQDLMDGTARRVPQDEALSTYESWPDEADFVVDSSWPARHAFNFVRAAPYWGQPVVAVGDQRFPVLAALRYDPAPTLDRPYLQHGDVLHMRCSPGILRVRVPAGQNG